MKKEKGSSSWPGKGLPCKWPRVGGSINRLGCRKTKTWNIRPECNGGTSHVRAQRNPFKMGVDQLVAMGKETELLLFQCKKGNKRSVELVIEALWFKGLCTTSSYLLRHKSQAEQKWPFLDLVLNESKVSSDVFLQMKQHEQLFLIIF